MSISSDVLFELAALQLAPDQMAGVLKIIARMMQENAERKAKSAARTRMYRRKMWRLPQAQWGALCAEVYARDGFECAYCSSSAGPFTVDHIIPVSRGGGHDLENLCVACARCNSSKHNRLLSEWIRP